MALNPGEAPPASDPLDDIHAPDLEDDDEVLASDGADSSDTSDAPKTPAAAKSPVEMAAELKAALEALSPEDRAKVYGIVQPGITRSLNLFNKQKQDLSASVAKTLGDMGIALPEGRTVMDLITEDGGKAFTDLIKGTVDASLKPVLDREKEKETASQLMGYAQLARETYPEVAERYDDAIKYLMSSEDLSNFAVAADGRNLPYALVGAAAVLERDQLRVKVAELEKKVEAQDLLKKTGVRTSRAGQTPVAGGNGSTKGIEAHARAALERIRSTEGA